MWRRRVDARNDASAGRGAVAPEMEGLCFRCYLPDHRKRDCTNEEVCVRCWLRGHPARECKRPRSPSSEEELRTLALAKFERRRSPIREELVGARRGPGREPGRAAAPAPPPRPVTPPPAPTPPPPPPPPPPAATVAPLTLSLPPMGAPPPLCAEPERAPLCSRVHEAPALCVVRRTAAMCDLERRLRFAMVASVGGRRPAVSAEQVAAALRWRGIPATAFSVHAHAPEDFLVVLESAEVSLVLEGIPPHAWDVDVVEDLLGKTCAVEEVAPETRSRADMSLFRLTTWTSQLAAIPVARTLAVPEPRRIVEGKLSPARELPESTVTQAEAPAASKVVEEITTLQYRVLMHVE
ncbi:hypothetical protein QYE76_056718 [Lolium multiflorum]|uniref:CCHC-type domain-containing protein n=1 Tax=Lolium multiflorum TaxID=4521 RepID=A0AAD8WN35_LOLMU|nr:hypothetical protein QYE76_016384 [Lolium multiflorum]KAK1574355.1 hypothetical protein QYE76_018594 [Lolium multiflorum]KAK1649385.1 hypothetical protein QYE76_067190 [Lolium multiflorum]KAK1668559.1 hypothetical protein QYE76_056718 [Lolium multiflorum]